MGTVSVVREDVQGDGTLIGQQKEDGKLKPSSGVFFNCIRVL